MLRYNNKSAVDFFRLCISASALLFFAVLPCSCGNSSRGPYSGPEEISIARLKELYDGEPVTVEGNYVIEGVVVSTDRWGNFYKTMFVQDGTGGVEVRLELDNIFMTYFTDGLVRISCRGLSLGAYGGFVQLGGPPAGGFEVGYIPHDDVAGHIEYMGAPQEKLLPLPLGFDDLTAANAGSIAGCLVAFGGVRFVEADGTAAWCEKEPESGFYMDTDRVLADSRGNTLVVRTSRYADFASLPLPRDEISIEGILSWFNGNYQLRVNNESAVYRAK